jgi:hypothetical protein
VGAFFRLSLQCLPFPDEQYIQEWNLTL